MSTRLKKCFLCVIIPVLFWSCTVEKEPKPAASSPSRPRMEVKALPSPAGPHPMHPEDKECAKRLLPLECGINFRDMGGYETKDGGVTRWGRLFRSGHLADLSESDLRTVAKLNLKLVIDFRTQAEYTAEPDRLSIPNPPRIVHLPIGQGERRANLERQFKSAEKNGGIGGQKINEIMNRALALDYLPEYRAMFRLLINPENQPVLFHCTAGRDRTGWAAALILLALDVPEKTVVEDYLASNLFYGPLVDHWKENPYARKKAEQIQNAGEDPSKVFEALKVRKSYLYAAFQAAKEKYGSMDAYLRDGLGLTDAMRKRLKKQFVTYEPK